MKRIVVLLVVSVLLFYAFRELSPFEKKLLVNMRTQVRELQHEKLYLHTDKSVYTVGEKVWFRAYLVHAAGMFPMVYSRYVYVDLVDQDDNIVRRVKVVEQDSCFYGQVEIPKDLQQGDYCLRAFTYYMQNAGEDYLFKKKIRVINPHDSKVQTEVVYTKGEGNNYIATICLKDGNGDPYARVPIMYVSGVEKNKYSRQNTKTDKEGKFDIQINSSIKSIEIEFREDGPFPFKRRVYVPSQLQDFDVQFFPEGGSLLSGNVQDVAFKAIRADGQAVHVTGSVYQDSVVVASIATRHDGMGKFRLPVNPGKRFHAVIRTENGMEKKFDLPTISDTGWGIVITGRDSVLHYKVIKGKNGIVPKELYMLAHCRGIVLGSNRVNGLSKGSLDLGIIPEGISHLVLLDGEGNMYSQRLFFKKHNKRPELKITSGKQTYISRELVEMEVDFEDEYKGVFEGSFSVSVTDDGKVVQDSLENHILSNLLLTSDLKGYIHNPAYYFNDTTPDVNANLDLVMMTHGWTRFDISKIAGGEFAPLNYPLEVGQIISGKVDNFWGKKSEGASIMLVSNYGSSRMATTDENGNFVIDGLVFRDSTSFMVKALNSKGRRNVNVKVDKDKFLPPTYGLLNTMETKKLEDDFFKKYGLNYYYENGEKVYVLDEVLVKQTKRKKSYSFYDRLASHQLDSVQIAEMVNWDIMMIIAELPGVEMEVDAKGNQYFGHFGRNLYVLVNEFEEDMDFIRLIPAKSLLSIALLPAELGKVFFGGKGGSGVLLITTDPGYVPEKLRGLNILPFDVLGFQVPDEFYVPKYDVDSVRLDNRYDTRSTIYWNPVIRIDRKNPAKFSFYTADTYGRYSVTIEGVTSNGTVFRKRYPLVLK